MCLCGKYDKGPGNLFKGKSERYNMAIRALEDE